MGGGSKCCVEQFAEGFCKTGVDRCSNNNNISVQWRVREEAGSSVSSGRSHNMMIKCASFANADSGQHQSERFTGWKDGLWSGGARGVHVPMKRPTGEKHPPALQLSHIPHRLGVKSSGGREGEREGA